MSGELWAQVAGAHDRWRQVIAAFRELSDDARSEVLCDALRDPDLRRYGLRVLREDPAIATAEVIRALVDEVVSGGPDLDLAAPILRQLPGGMLGSELKRAHETFEREPNWLALERLLWVYALIGDIDSVRSLLRLVEHSPDPDMREIVEAYRQWSVR